MYYGWKSKTAFYSAMPTLSVKGMKMMSKLLALLFSTAIIGATLTACGNKNNSEAQKNTESSQTETQNTTETATTADSSRNNSENGINEVVTGAETAINGVVTGGEDIVNGVVSEGEDIVNDIVDGTDNSDSNR